MVNYLFQNGTKIEKNLRNQKITKNFGKKQKKITNWTQHIENTNFKKARVNFTHEKNVIKNSARISCTKIVITTE